MSFTGKEDHDFPLDKASKWTANYRAKFPEGIKGHYFGEQAIKKILTQKHCVGLRIYNALDERGIQQLIIVGVDRDQNDLFEGLLAERSISCPPVCGVDNPLNS